MNSAPVARRRRQMRAAPLNKPSLTLLFTSFLRLGLTAFGGPAMVAYIKEMAVRRRRWLGDDTFQDGVALVQTIPGATAMQMAAYVGLKARGIGGAFLSYLAFGLPAFLLMLVFSVLYVRGHDLQSVIALFAGLQVIVVAIVASATLGFARQIIKGARILVIAAAGGVLLGAGVSPFLVISGSALIGIIFFINSGKQAAAAPDMERSRLRIGPVTLLLALVAAAMAILFLVRRELFDLAALMLRIDLFAFGGGFASLPLMLFEVVGVRGWMTSNTFMNGIAMGQVTPGPIVMTTTFIGYFVFGLPGALIASAAIFTPSFILVVIITPFFDSMKRSAWVARASTGILASFVGLLAYVTVRFAVAVPWDPFRALLAAAALLALLKKVDIIYVVIAGAVLSVLFLR